MIRQRSPKRQLEPVRVTYFFAGILVGFLLSSLLFIFVSLDPPMIKHSKSHFMLPLQENELSMSSQNGWKLLHVYVGTNVTAEHKAEASTIPNDYFHSTRWFSQLRQDFLISQLLRGKRGGYFVDLAANDAIRISNTFALEANFGWMGLAIEPNPVYWSGLAYRNCAVIGAVVGNTTGAQLRFKFPKRAAPTGGLVGNDFDNKVDLESKSSNNQEAQTRYSVALGDILDRFNAPSVIDYLSLDVEGAETFVLESFPFERYRFNLLTVERADTRLRELLARQGYKQLKQLKKWGETLWMHSSASSILDMAALTIDTENYKYREIANHLPTAQGDLSDIRVS